MDAAEAGDERDGQEAVGVHLSPQEEISLQVVQAEVVLASKPNKSTRTLIHLQLYNRVSFKNGKMLELLAINDG